MPDEPNAASSDFHPREHRGRIQRARGVSDKTRFLNVAQGSLEECRYYLIPVEDLGYGTAAEMELLLGALSKLIVAYASAIESNRQTAPKFCNS